ncbi:hypothetical protein EYF80_023986 [Liparis tanakae]|uniref:Uncharacterized protein n=1 Tax=Liparis tanakae TaxID=230148 RepID=A0A4Z2HLL2_9TELE|nr:hypothetical protein EYF80_023986 [Liparis tanakae]
MDYGLGKEPETHQEFVRELFQPVSQKSLKLLSVREGIKVYAFPSVKRLFGVLVFFSECARSSVLGDLSVDSLMESAKHLSAENFPASCFSVDGEILILEVVSGIERNKSGLQVNETTQVSSSYKDRNPDRHKETKGDHHQTGDKGKTGTMPVGAGVRHEALTRQEWRGQVKGMKQSRHIRPGNTQVEPIRDRADRHRDRKCRETEDAREKDFKIRQETRHKTSRQAEVVGACKDNSKPPKEPCSFAHHVVLDANHATLTQLEPFGIRGMWRVALRQHLLQVWRPVELQRPSSLQPLPARLRLREASARLLARCQLDSISRGNLHPRGGEVL